MTRIFVILVFLMVSSGLKAADYIWSQAVPEQIHIVPDGLVLIGDFNQSGVACATAPRSLFLPKSDPNFESKLSLALTANASQKSIRVLFSLVNQNCFEVRALGKAPVVHHYYWQLRN